MGYTTEIMPFSMRSKGLSCELLSIYCSLIIAAFVNPIGLGNIGWKYYIVFCCLLVVILSTTYFTFPETKGYSLEEIAQIFDGPGALVDGQETERKLSEVAHDERIEEGAGTKA